MSSWSYTIPRSALGMFIGKSGRNIRALQDIPHMSVLLNDVQLTVHSSDIYRIQLVKDNIKAIVEEARRIDHGFESSRMHQLQFNSSFEDEAQQFYRPRAQFRAKVSNYNRPHTRYLSRPLKNKMPFKRKLNIARDMEDSMEFKKSKPFKKRSPPKSKQQEKEETSFDEEQSNDDHDGDDGDDI